MSDQWRNKLFFGDNVEIMRKHIPDKSVDLIYLDPSSFLDFMIGFAQPPLHQVFGWCGVIDGWYFLAGVKLNYTAAGLLLYWNHYTQLLKEFIMNIKPYKELIKNIPYKEQAFIPNKRSWENILDSLNLNFIINWERGYSRNELFDIPLSEEKIISILMWGYPKGGRGNNIRSILKHLKKILSAINDYDNKDVNLNELLCIASRLNKINHLGRATWSKILYFCNIKFNNQRLLILDKKITDCVSDIEINGIEFSKITSNIESYVDYNLSMAKVASKYEFQVDQLELFIFLFSKILRLRIVT